MFMKRSFAPAALWPLLLAAHGTSIAPAQAGIPEPDLIWYGRVSNAASGTPVRVTTGTLIWRVEPIAGGPAIVVSTPLTNINDQFSFAVRVPCETPEPGASPSATTLNLTTPASRYRRVSVTLDGQPVSLVSAPGEWSLTPAERGRVERVDLQIGIAAADTDGDGLADAWERQYFGSLSARPGDDADGDGISNLREYQAGTNPNDEESLFEIIAIAPAANGISVQWSSQPGQSYRVRRSPSLLGSPADYQVIQSGLAATPPLNSFVDTTATSHGHFFYLIEIEQ